MERTNQAFGRSIAEDSAAFFIVRDKAFAALPGSSPKVRLSGINDPFGFEEKYKTSYDFEIGSAEGSDSTHNIFRQSGSFHERNYNIPPKSPQVFGNPARSSSLSLVSEASRSEVRDEVQIPNLDSMRETRWTREGIARRTTSSTRISRSSMTSSLPSFESTVSFQDKSELTPSATLDKSLRKDSTRVPTSVDVNNRFSLAGFLSMGANYGTGKINSQTSLEEKGKNVQKLHSFGQISALQARSEMRIENEAEEYLNQIRKEFL